MCSAPSDGSQTVEVDNSKSYLTGMTYTYVCNEDFATADDVVTTCQADGSWSLTSLPTCIGNILCFRCKHSLSCLTRFMLVVK